jgi:hypothetical protein
VIEKPANDRLSDLSEKNRSAFPEAQASFHFGKQRMKKY